MGLSQRDINAVASAVINKIAEYGYDEDDAAAGGREQYARDDLAAADVTGIVRYAREHKIADGAEAVSKYRAAKAKGLIR